MGEEFAVVAKRIPIFLLKTPAPDADGYAEWFSREELLPSHTNIARFVPVLGHHPVHDALDQLGAMLAHPQEHFWDAAHNKGKYAAITFTSQRAVEGFRAVVTQLYERDPTFVPPTLEYYVVGVATERVLAATPGVDPKRISGSECGTSAELALHIRGAYNTIYGGIEAGKKPGVLFLTGAKHRDDLKRILDLEAPGTAAHIGVQEMVIYETREEGSFAGDIAAAIEEERGKGPGEMWFVVFSPNGCGSLLNVLGWLDEETQKVKKGLDRTESGVYLATIGPTTRDFLVKTFGCQPDVVASKPTPEGIGDGIRQSITSR